MGAYEDTSWADLRALTRQRRQEATERRIASLLPPVRFSVLDGSAARHERDWAGSRAWRKEQWRLGNRHCAYCHRKTTLRRRLPLSMTTDHVDPFAPGGADSPWNWAVACAECNNRKGTLSAAEFRRILACEALAAA